MTTRSVPVSVPAKDPKIGQLEEAIKAAIATLEGTECSFWACDGPDAPFVSMKTCNICATVQDLRAALS